MFTIEEVTNLHWTSPDNDRFDCSIKYAEFDTVMPFACSNKDPLAHAQELWNRAMAGEFGAITAYAEPVNEQPVATQPQPVSSGVQTL